VLIGNTTSLTTAATSIPSATLYIPLQFWFCRNPGLNCMAQKRELHSFSNLINYTLNCNKIKLRETPKAFNTKIKRKLFSLISIRIYSDPNKCGCKNLKERIHVYSYGQSAAKFLQVNYFWKRFNDYNILGKLIL
jgi:hypothetical protein